MIDVRFRPLLAWPRPDTKGRRGRQSFKAPWSRTLALLHAELRHLGARDAVIEIALREQDIRLDGWPRSDAREPSHPGVILSFTSRHGPLRYMTDEYVWWQHNVRAIALGLNALRAVDRYGITSSGEQYKGWTALPAAPDAAMSVGEAARWIATELHNSSAVESFDLDTEVLGILADERAYRFDYRKLAALFHPDRVDGGDERKWRQLQQAKQALDAHHQGATV